MKNFFAQTAFVFMLFSSSAWALGDGLQLQGVGVTALPIVGYEFTHLMTPTEHAKGMFIYGLRVIAGNARVAAESEYTRGSGSDWYPDQNLKVNSTKENLKVGARTTYAMERYLLITGRAGGQATREKADSIIDEVTTTNDGAWVIRPYLGFGVEVALGSQFSLMAESTYILNSLSDLGKNDLQTNFGVKINLGG